MTNTGDAVEATEPHRDKINRALRNKRRLRAIEEADVLEAARTMPALNRAVRIVAHALRVPVVQLNVLTGTSLVPIAVYVRAGENGEAWEMERRAGSSYCKLVILSRDALQVDDALTDPRVRRRHATREQGIGAYLAVPIRVPGADDQNSPVIGTLCAIDRVARAWTDEDRQILTDIAAGCGEFIASRKHLRADMRGVAQQADRVLEATAVAVLATDARGVITYANPAATRVLGYSADEMLGRDQHALIHHSRADGRKYPERDCGNYVAMNTGRSCRTTNDTYWRSDGSSITVESTMTPIFDRSELIGTVLSFIDVTQRRSEEESAHTARIAAEVANRAKTELLVGMSTELGLSLVEIQEGSVRLEALLRGGGTEQQVEEVRAIQRSHRHLVGLMDNLRQFATLEVSRSERAS